jgi:hypothetical protein
VEKYVRSIPVEDANGCWFEVYEYVVRRRVFGFVREARRFMLDTEEEAEPLDANTCAVIGTGERFCA